MTINKSLSFSKMHGLGNDFIVVNNLKREVSIENINIPQLANRHTGIGFDQLLLIEPAEKGDFFCRIFNADGSEASQCGNGLRCVARFLHENKLHLANDLTIQTNAGIFPIKINDYQHIQVALGKPQVSEQSFNLDGKLAKFTSHLVLIGNSHIISKVSSIQSIDTSYIANEITSLPQFADGINLGFMQIVNPSHIKLKTIERGAGETHACGSNACAAVATGIIHYGLENIVKVELQYGFLTVEWRGGNEAILLAGAAERVFEGELGLDVGL